MKYYEMIRTGKLLTDPILVPEQMEAMIKKFPNKKLHPIESAALFHLKPV